MLEDTDLRAEILHVVWVNHPRLPGAERSWIFTYVVGRRGHGFGLKVGTEITEV